MLFSAKGKGTELQGLPFLSSEALPLLKQTLQKVSCTSSVVLCTESGPLGINKFVSPLGELTA